MKKGLVGMIVLVLGVVIILISGFLLLVWYVEKNGALKNCSRDSDCIKAQVTCCPCSSGGEEKCISRTEAQNYASMLKNCSRELFCAQVYKCNIKYCKCVAGKCAE